MRRSKIKKEEIAEDYCFVCKDGGLLMVCDYKSKINITGPSTQLEDDRIVHERIKQSVEILNRMKDIVCLIISYPPMSLVNGESYKRNQYKWVRDILKINDVVREMEAPSKKKEIDAFKLENQISTLMTHYMDEIEPLFPQVVIAKSFSGIDVERHGQIMPTPKRMYDLAVDFAIREILQHIECPKIRKIGISGSHGETVISELWGKLQECCIFDHVIDVEVSRCSTIEEIRFSIERDLFPSTSGERKLDETLKGTNFFILLHEVGERVNLYDMGTNWWNSKKIQKIVYTTNSQHVDDVTAVGVEIRMENHLLSWELFCVNVGEVVHSSGIQRLAINVVEKCCGHLLAVVIMARALKDVTDVLIWEYASYTLGLQHRSQTKDRVLFNALAFMWGRSGSTNKYLQYCVDMENWGQMDKVDLIEEWITSGLVGTFDEGEQIVGDLVNAFLLESFQYGDSNFVRMRSEIHEELFNFLRFESCSPFLRLGGWGLTEPPKDEAWEKASEMHLMNNKLSELPTSPHGSQLKVLFLQSNHHLRAIPPIFFEGLPVLQILDLSYTRIRSLPQSLVKLFELRIFFLRGCELLMELPPEVGKLRNLEVLNLEGTKIINLPIDVERLTKLKCLNVSFHGYRKNQSSTLIPRNVIQQLFQLQELRIDVNPDDEQWNATMEDIVKEVCSLKQLEALKIYLPQVAPLDHFMKNGTSSVYTSLVHFRFVVGSHHSRIISRLPNELAIKFELQARSLKYVNGEGIPSQIKEVLQHCTALFLDRHLTLTKLSEFGIGNMKKLEFCVLGECYKIETIVDGAENCKQREDDGDVYGENILGSLQFLRLHYMKNLVSIWKGPVWRGCLSSLKSLALHECPQLTTIFTLGLLENLNSLEELVAEWCPEINSIVTLEDPAEHRPFPLRTYLPNLRKISLHYVPKLVNISSGLRIAPKLEWMSFYNCPLLETLSDMEVCCHGIKVIIGEADWWSTLKRSSYFGLAQWHNVFVPIKSDADLATQIEEIENQLLAKRQERKPSQQSGEAERQERKPSQQSGEAERQERKPSQQSGSGGFMKALAFVATTASKKMKIRMALEAAAVETAVTDVYRDGRSLLSWSGRKFGYWKNLKRNHEDLMQKARELWELSNGIREGISQNRIKLDAAEWIVKVEMNESEVIELDTKYNDRKNHPWKLFRFWRVLVLAKTWLRSATKFIVFGKRENVKEECWMRNCQSVLWKYVQPK
ncbi:disease resistance protein At4g27190 isoform X2 [Vitis vinifera]|uniref:disease resistance protein At4g27190 isoform X2 n=1 Tax=Vitis vinifera TaxID=29760 RepID=UPI0008FEB2E6|nr:disease resistance protein At4g27190 isoform X2 [Vitis vinifera]XP_059597193.1 disease resistance protein At4g27190 isoform X2 [Vitis vinifera]|eukprot:XP_010657929.2 PREDICTED: disease resistance protein At4g27190 isoform X3 [Vitis vinifera]